MPSKRSSARQLAAAQHEFLVDRSLGRLALVTKLRSVGLVVRTLADVYGEDAAQETQDTEWIRLAAGPYLYGVYKDTIKKLWPPEA